MNIFLVGPMGSGKTVCGQELASRLGLKFVDLDRVLEAAEGRTVNEIFEDRGEPYFREREKQIFRAIASMSGQVVATGGGTVIDPENRALAKKMGVVVYLKGDLETLWERVKDARDRPLLAVGDPKALLAELVRARQPFYEEAAVTVATDGKAPPQIAQEILRVLRLEDAGRLRIPDVGREP